MSLIESPRMSLAGSNPAAKQSARPRLAFLGVGWIGLARMESLIAADIADVVAVADMNSEAIDAARQTAVEAIAASSMDEFLDTELDGIVIATPSALHAEQARAALEQGVAVFCQKPLARTAEETRQIINAAREADLPLGIDFSYRHVKGVDQMRRMVQEKTIGELYAIDLIFHNAYGPDKAWFYDAERSGGGCVIDLGIHLIDLAGWIGGDWAREDVHSTLWRHGRRLNHLSSDVEDCAFAHWRIPSGATARLACSWNISAGQDAVIEATFYGTDGAVALKNVAGSFFDFTVEHWEGTNRRQLAGPPDAWGGRALIQWARMLAEGRGFDEETYHAIAVAQAVDAIYGRTVPSCKSR